MRKRLRKAIRKLKAGKLSRAVHALATPHHSEARITTAKKAVADYLRQHHNNLVAYGPFKGMQLPAVSSWGGADVSAKILGTYEKQIVSTLVAHSCPNGLLVDLGAADGFFAVGALRAGLFETALCFDASEKARRVLSANAEANGVVEKIKIEGEATENTIFSSIPKGQKGALLCDIEGAEFQVLTDDLLAHLKSMVVIVELHDFLMENGEAMRRALLDRATRHFDVEILRGADPELSAFRELNRFDDDHRLLALSEGRDQAMEWLVLRPRERG